MLSEDARNSDNNVAIIPFPCDWKKPRFFYGERVSTDNVHHPIFFFGYIRGMFYRLDTSTWFYTVEISPQSELIVGIEFLEPILKEWNECEIIRWDK